jgi:hypothetical protein
MRVSTKFRVSTEQTTTDDYADLLLRLAQMPAEAEWLEFKVDNDDPQEIGQQLSALSNAASYITKIEPSWSGVFTTKRMTLSGQSSSRVRRK